MIADQLMDRIEDEAERRARKLWVAYVFWLFTGLVSGHRWYLRMPEKALLQAGLMWVGVGWFWWIADAFLLPGLVERANREEEDRLIEETALAAAMVETSRRDARLAAPSDMDREIALEVGRSLRADARTAGVPPASGG